MDDDFQIITTPDVEIAIDDKVQIKTILNKVSKKHDLVSNDVCHLKPKWSDNLNKDNIGKVYDCLNITKIFKDEEEKVKKLKSFSVLSNDKILSAGLLDFFRCNDGNRDYFSTKYISFAICHPLKKLLIVGSNEGTLGLFKVDGEQNDALCKPLYFSNFPIKGGQLVHGGQKLIFYSKRNQFKIFNLATSAVTDHAIAKGCRIKRIAVSPTDDYLVLASQNSVIHVVSTKSFDVVHKMVVSGAVKSLAFSHSGKYLYAFQEPAVVSVFEFQEDGRPLFRRQWNDHGAIAAVCIAVSADDRYVACGSPGNVNIYQLNDTWQSQYPSPVKSIQYEGTRINQIVFNHSSELLAIGYCFTNDMNTGSYKLVHLRSMTVFSNFPGPGGKVRATSLSFSPGDKFLAVGQFTGRVALFNLRYYNKY